MCVCGGGGGKGGRLNAKNTVQAGEENLVVSTIKSCRKIQQKNNRNVVIVQSGENVVSSR